MDVSLQCLPCHRPLHPLPATSALFTVGGQRLSRTGVSLGAAKLHTHCQFPQKKKNSTTSPGHYFFFFSFFLTKWYHDFYKALRLKTAVWSMFITSRVLNLTIGGLAMRWVGQRAELRQSQNLFPVIVWQPSSLICLCVHCCRHTGSAPCPNACLETSCWAHFCQRESLTSTHSMRSV